MGLTLVSARIVRTFLSLRSVSSAWRSSASLTRSHIPVSLINYTIGDPRSLVELVGKRITPNTRHGNRSLLKDKYIRSTLTCRTSCYRQSNYSSCSDELLLNGVLIRLLYRAILWVEETEVKIRSSCNECMYCRLERYSTVLVTERVLSSVRSPCYSSLASSLSSLM